MTTLFDNDQPDQFHETNSASVWKKAATWLRQSFYEGLYQLFNHAPTDLQRSKHQKLYFVLVNAFTGLQLISLLEVGGHTQLWEEYNQLWSVLLYFRIDQQCGALGLINECVILSQVASFCLLLLFGLACFFARRKHYIPSLIKYLVKAGFFLMFQLFFIPNLVLAELYLFQTVFQGDSISRIDTNQLQGSIVALPFVGFAACSSCLLKYAYIIGSAELRHAQQTKDVSARAHSAVEVLELKLRLVSTVFYVMHSSLHVHYFLVLVLFSEGYILLQYFWQLPYYNAAANRVKMAVCASTGFCALAFLLGKAFDNAGVTLLLAVFVTPAFVLLIVTKFFDERQSLVGTVTAKTLNNCSSHLDLERKLRKKLVGTNGGDDFQVIRLISTYFKSAMKRKNALLVVWEANYCLYTLKDERLARIKLSKSLLTSPGLESDFQTFICNKNLDASDTEYFEDSEFLQFKLRLDQTKKSDLSVCYVFCQLIEELEQPLINLPKITSLLHCFNTLNDEVTSAYEELSSKYTDGQEINALYCSYLVHILKDIEGSEKVQQRGAAAKSHMLQHNRNLSYFDDENGLMIVSGEFNSLGTIVFANQQLAEILSEPLPHIVGNNLSSYIPFPFNFNHNKNLERYLLTCTDTHINVPSSTFISNQVGYLVEVKLKIRCIAVGSNAFFLVLMKRRHKHRELVLVDDLWNVLGQSTNAHTAAKSQLNSLVGLNMKHLSPDIAFDALVDYDRFASATDSSVEFVYRQKKNANVYMRYFLIYSDQPANVQASEISSVTRVKGLKFQDQAADQEEENVFPGGSSNNEELVRHAKVRKLEDVLRGLITRVRWAVCALIVSFVGLGVLLTLYLLYMTNTLYLYETFEQAQTIQEVYYETMATLRLVQLAEDNSDFQKELTTHVQEFLVVLADYKDLEMKILKEFTEYPVLTDFVQQEVYYWDTVGTTSIQSTLPSNIIDEFIRQANSFDVADPNSLEFIILNGLGAPYKYLVELNELIAQTTHEEKNRLAVEFSLIILGTFGVILVSLALLSQFTFSLRKRSAQYWHKLLKEFKVSSVQMKADIARRLEMVHNKDPDSFSKGDARSPSKIPVGVFEYIWRILVIGISACGYLLLLYHLYIDKEIEAIDTRVRYYTALLDSHRNIEELNFWTKEMILWTSEDSLLTILDTVYPLKEPGEELAKIYDKLREVHIKLLDAGNSAITSQEAYELFTYYDDSHVLTRFGIVPGMNSAIYESSYYASTQTSLEGFIDFYENLESLQEGFHSFNIQFNESTIEILDANERAVLLLNLFGALFNTVLVTFLYSSFIRYRRNLLNWKTNLYNIITKQTVAGDPTNNA